MVSQSSIIPIATFSAIIVAMLAFIIWWFPRTWNKGNAEERAIVDQQVADLAMLRAQQQQQQGVSRPHDGDDAKPPPVYVPRDYRPPVAGMG